MKYRSIILTVATAVSLNAGAQSTQKFSPSNTVIAWDFHDVFAYKPVFKMAGQFTSLIWHAPNSWELIRFLFSPTFVREVYLQKKALDTGERILEKMMVDHPQTLGQHRNEIFSIINLHELDQRMVDLLAKLKSLGYKNVLASNIGPESLKLMQREHPEFFALFDGLYFDGTKNSLGKLYSCHLKPSLDYFKGLKQYLIDIGINFPHIIFIDDRRANLDGARMADVGIEPFHFVSYRQLMNELTKKGILGSTV